MYHHEQRVGVDVIINDFLRQIDTVVGSLCQLLTGGQPTLVIGDVSFSADDPHSAALATLCYMEGAFELMQRMVSRCPGDKRQYAATTALATCQRIQNCVAIAKGPHADEDMQLVLLGLDAMVGRVYQLFSDWSGCHATPLG